MSAETSRDLADQACVSRMPARPLLLRSIDAAATILILSGLLHLSLFVRGNLSWEGPISPRKPALFGISAGLTIYSLAWCWNVLRRDRQILRVCAAVSWGLFFEVFLITIQYWRGTPSHFNRSTWIDLIIEAAMLGLICGVFVGIAWITWFSMKPFEVDAGQILVIRAGLTFLIISCLLGFATMLAGEFNIAVGRPIEIWGRSGVLKYPHGAVLHALQILPALNWGLIKFHVPRRIAFLQIAVTAHCVFLLHTIWQTCNGRGRFELDPVGLLSLLTAVFLFITPVIAITVCGLACGNRVTSGHAAPMEREIRRK